MKKSSSWQISGDFFINHKDKGFIGKGRIQLLEYIDSYGSLNKAARKMKMGYKAAWDTIHSMNSLDSSPLVEFQTGGKGGGGATLTENGKRWIEAYKKIEEKSNAFLREMNDEIHTMINGFFD